MEKTIVLLRGVNVGGNRKLPMAELRDACRKAGLADIETYIASGNLIFSAKSAAEAEKTIESLVESAFGFKVEAIARTAKQWAVYAKGSPFPDAEKDRGNILHLGISKQPLLDGLTGRIAERAAHGEQVIVKGDAIWIDFHDGVRDTKISPTFLDKAAGSTVTMRNWRTVCKLAEMTAG